MPASVRHRPDSALGLLVELQGNPRTRFPWAACFKLAAAVSLLRDAPAVLSFKPTANPSPIADHGKCGATFRASPSARNRRRIGADPADGDHAKPSLGCIAANLG